MVALLGRSGSGKTTLLNCLLGWERPDRGEVRVPGVADPATAGWSTVAVVPQRFGLLDELSLADNVALPARLAGLASRGPRPPRSPSCGWTTWPNGRRTRCRSASSSAPRWPARWSSARRS